MNKYEITVRKRNGVSEPFSIEKIHKILNWATDGVRGVSVTDLVLKAQFDIRKSVSSTQLHQLLIDAALNCFSLETPNYQWVASRLLNFSVRKQVWGGVHPPRLVDFIRKMVDKDLYDRLLLDKYTEDEINKLGEYIKHDRDFGFTYAGIKQMCDKYLLQNRSTKELYETPQLAYMAIAMTVFHKYPAETRLQWVKNSYDAFSRFKINIPTPQMAGIRTKLRAYSSCCLIDCGDDMDSILATASAVGKATSQRYGIGINVSRIRAINSLIRGGEVIHTGLIPFLKVFEAMTKSCQQNGLRGGGGTVNCPFFHLEIESVLPLKNNGGTDDSRVRQLDYVIQLSKLFYQRVLDNGYITLFSPHQARDLFDAFGGPDFDELYKKYEESSVLAPMRRRIPARELSSLLIKERTETGRVYVANLDHIWGHGAWRIKPQMLNLCVEIAHPTKPLTHLEDPEGEIGVCVLSAINWLEIKDQKDFEQTCEIIVRMLEELIDHQDYFCPAAANFTLNRRSLGVGINNLAAFLAERGMRYENPETPNLVARYMEQQQFFLLKASCKLAAERGACAKFGDTKYAQGILPIDTYKKDVDEFVTEPLAMDWEWLRAQIKEHGLRHSTLSAIMPCESSSVLHSATNGIEPPRALLSFKKSKASSIPMLVPNATRCGKNYSLAFEIKDNKHILNISAAIAKFIDMSMSTNLYYRYTDYPDNKLPDVVVLKDLLYAYKVGCPAIYYSVTDEDMLQEEDGCSGGACAI